MRIVWLWLVLLIVPFVTHDNVLLSLVIFSFILGIVAVSFNVIFGLAGQLSLFHAAAFGLGGYTTYLSMKHWGVSFWIGMLCGAVFVGVLALVIGAICFRFRLKEFYFAIVTLAFAEIARLIVLNWNSLTNGTQGINFSLKPSLWLPGSGVIPVLGTTMWYYLSLVGLILAVAFYSLLAKSWVGRTLAAIRLNEDLAETLGINIFRYKLAIFVLGSMGGAAGGSLYAFYIGFVEPQYLSADQSLAILSMALLGGKEFVAAPAVGAAVLTALPHLINLNAELRLLVYGLILIATILLLPRGIVGTLIKRRHVS